MLQRHAARGAAHARAAQPDLHDALTHPDDFDVAPVGLNVGSQQVDDLAYLRKEGILM